MKINKYYLLAVIFGFLSSIRVIVLPEIQFILAVMFLFKNRGLSKSFIFFLMTIFCTHHYAIPDAFYRFNSELYPSIYTKAYSGIKILDVLIVFLFLFSIKKIKNVKRLLNKKFPFILIFIAPLGIIFLSKEKIAFDIFLFTLRSYMLFFVFFVETLNFRKLDYIKLSKLIVFSWTIKMFFAILIPHNSPLYREIFGIKGIIFFAGDEYLTIGIYYAIFCATKAFQKKELLRSFFSLNFILLLTIISQRKGAIPYFTFINVMLLVYYFYKNKTLHKLYNFYVILSPIITFIFIAWGYNFLNPLIKLAISEYHELSLSALKSIMNIQNTNIYSFLFGISPFGKYEIIDLNPLNDHLMSFGKEVGEKYRYQLWTIPGDRLLLNTGLIGFICYYIYALRYAFSENMYIYSLYYIGLGIFSFSLMTPISGFTYGIVVSFLVNYYSKEVINEGLL